MGAFRLGENRLNLKELKEILQILDEKEITEFELEEEGIKLRIRKALPSRDDGARGTIESAAPPTISAAELRPPNEVPAGAPTPSASPAGHPPGRAAAEDPSLVLVKSPIVGTFY